MIRVGNEIGCFFVKYLIGLDAESAIETLQLDACARASINGVSECLHFAWAVNVNAVVVLKLIGVQRIELWPKVIVNCESDTVVVNSAGKLLKCCCYVNMSVDHHVAAHIEDRLWGARCVQENTIFPRRICTLNWVAKCGNSHPF